MSMAPPRPRPCECPLCGRRSRQSARMATPPQLARWPWTSGLASSSRQWPRVPQDGGGMFPAPGDPQLAGRQRDPQSQAGVAEPAGAVSGLWGVSHRGDGSWSQGRSPEQAGACWASAVFLCHRQGRGRMSPPQGPRRPSRPHTPRPRHLPPSETVTVTVTVTVTGRRKPGGAHGPIPQSPGTWGAAAPCPPVPSGRACTGGPKGVLLGCSCLLSKVQKSGLGVPLLVGRWMACPQVPAPRPLGSLLGLRLQCWAPGRT